MLAVLDPGRCLESFLQTVRLISTHLEPMVSHGEPFWVPEHLTLLQVLFLKILVSELFWIFWIILTPRGPGRYLKSFLEAVGFISADWEPVASHGDPFRVPGLSAVLQLQF